MAAETMVRMGEFACSAVAGHVLVSLGLGSCIGLALLDKRAAVAGLAHVVLPAAEGRTGSPGKFADTAVEALIAELVGLGARRIALEAVLVGGASMFKLGGGSGMEVGQRNDEAVRAELARLRIPVAATDTGGSRGRTIRVTVGSQAVTSRAAGDQEVALYPRIPARVAA
jgi:chemotaxis protein CheD